LTASVRPASGPAPGSPVVDVGEEDRDFDDVGEPAPCRREHGAHVLEDLTRLCDDVVAAHEAPVGIDRDDPGDVEEVARAHGVGEVRDGLRLALDAKLLTAHRAPFCSSLNRILGLIRSGSTGNSRSEGFPDASARSNAASKSSVRSTRSP
jgi:hypothetical protein